MTYKVSSGTLSLYTLTPGSRNCATGAVTCRRRGIAESEVSSRKTCCQNVSKSHELFLPMSEGLHCNYPVFVCAIDRGVAPSTVCDIRHTRSRFRFIYISTSGNNESETPDDDRRGGKLRQKVQNCCCRVSECALFCLEHCEGPLVRRLSKEPSGSNM